MKHTVRIYNKENKMVYENIFGSAENAYEEYMENIRVIKKCIGKDEEYTVARYNDDVLMTAETIRGKTK